MTTTDRRREFVSQQVRRAAIEQISYLCQTLPLPENISLESQVVTVHLTRQAVDAWLAVSDPETAPERRPSSRAGWDHAKWGPEGARQFAISAVIPSLPTLTAVQS